MDSPSSRGLVLRAILSALFAHPLPSTVTVTVKDIIQASACQRPRLQNFKFPTNLRPALVLRGSMHPPKPYLLQGHQILDRELPTRMKGLSRLTSLSTGHCGYTIRTMA